MQTTLATPFPSTRRIMANRSNALRSTGPRTAAGKQRSALNALTHCPVPRPRLRRPRRLPAAREQFRNEYQPKTPTEAQLVQELIDTSWRLNRIPLLEAALLNRAAHPPSEQAAIQFDIVDAHNAVARLGLHGQRLSRQFQKTLDQLRDIQAERRERERRQLRDAAALLEMHKHKGLPFDPAQFGFVFSSEEIAAHSHRLMRLNESRHFDYVCFDMTPPRACAHS